MAAGDPGRPPETRAIDDVDRIARQIATVDLQAGLRFHDAVVDMCDLLGRLPLIGTRRVAVDPRLGGL